MLRDPEKKNLKKINKLESVRNFRNDFLFNGKRSEINAFVLSLQTK